MRVVNEKFDLIGNFSGIAVFDANHAYEEFQRWFPHLSSYDYKKALQQGIDKIKKQAGSGMGNYMVISKTHGLRIPLEIRPDKMMPRKVIGVVPTTLNPREVINLRKEIEVFTEKVENRETYSRFPIYEGFSYFAQHGKIISDFDEIFVE